MIRLIKKWFRKKFGKKAKRCNFCGRVMSQKEIDFYGTLCEDCEKLFLERLFKNG